MVAVANGYWDWESNLQKFTVLCLFFPKSSLILPLEMTASHDLWHVGIEGVLTHLQLHRVTTMWIYLSAQEDDRTSSKESMFATNMLGRS